MFAHRHFSEVASVSGRRIRARDITPRDESPSVATVPLAPTGKISCSPRPRNHGLFAALQLTLATLLLVILFASTARAHDPFEAFHSAILRPDRLDLTVTMAQSTALRLIEPDAHVSALTPENLAAHRVRLVRAGAALFTLTSVSSALTARKVEIELTEENDVIFRITYPRPAPGRLLFLAAYLKKLGDGYGGILEINDAAEHNLGWEQLLWAHPSFAVTIPGAD